MTSETESKVNQKTIADHLQVSVATVSKALSGQSDISQAMRERIEQAAMELGYQSQRARRRLPNRSVTCPIVGVFLRRPLEGGTKNAPTYLGGMSRASAELNVSLVVQEWKPGDDPHTLLDKRHQPPVMREGALSGLALGGEWPVEVISALSRKHQVVLFPQYTLGSHVDVIGLDNLTVVLRIVEHLKQLGHERIGFVGRSRSLAWACDRFGGYVSAVDRLGLPYEPGWVIDIDELPMLNEGHQDYWREIVDQLEATRKKHQVDAWVCSSDWPAFQIYRGMLDRGYRIPEDLSLTGFDDTEAVNLGCPPVSSVRVPRDTIGEATLKQLVYRLENPQAPHRHSWLSCEFVDHGTTGAPTYFLNNQDKPTRLAPTIG